MEKDVINVRSSHLLEKQFGVRRGNPRQRNLNVDTPEESAKKYRRICRTSPSPTGLIVIARSLPQRKCEKPR